MDLKVKVLPPSRRSVEQLQYLREMIADGCLSVDGIEYTAHTGWTVWALQETGVLVQTRAEPYIVGLVNYTDRNPYQDNTIEGLRDDLDIVSVYRHNEPEDWSGPIYTGNSMYAVTTPYAYHLLKTVGLLVEDAPVNSFFQPYNLEVSSADAEMVTNAQGGKQSYQPGAFELLPPIALTEVAKVMAHGAAKYEAWNWTAIPSHMHLRSAMGHLFSFIAGDTTEGGDRYHHLTHAATRLLFTVEMYARETGLYTKAD